MGAILDRLRSILDRSKRLEKLAEPVKQIMLAENKRRALAGVDYEGIRLAVLKPATLEDRKRKGYPAGPPLVRQGANARIITACKVEVTVRDGQLRFLKSWPSIPWLEYHTLGTRRMARRDIMGWGREEINQARALLPRHVLGRP